MRIPILSSALEYLYIGRLFYDAQEDDLGEDFFDSLFVDIDSLIFFTQASIPKSLAISACWPNGSLMQFITPLMGKFGFIEYLIYADTLTELEKPSNNKI